MSAKIRERTVQMPLLQMRAEFSPGSFNAEKRTIELVWSVGKKGLRGFYDPYYEELSMNPAHVRMGRLESGNSPFIDNHERWRGNPAVLGRILSGKLETGKGTAVVRLEDAERLENIDAKDTIRKIESGTLVNCSVGYTVYKYQRQPSVEGEEIPTYLAVDWEPTEISIVPVGFDENAVVRGKNEKTAPCVFINLPEERNKEALMDENEKKEMERKAAEDKAAAEKAAAEKARADEKSRQSEIRSICTRLGLEESFAKRMIDEDKPLDEVRKLVIDEKAKQSATTEIRSANPVLTCGADSSEKFRDGASQWLIQRAGSGVSAAVEKHTSKKAEAGEFRGMSLVELARESLIRHGVNVKGMDKMALVGMALTHRGVGTQSTSDFAILLENTMHKVLLASYATTPDTWSRFCKKGSVSDFRAHPRYRRGFLGRLDKVGQNGEFKNKAVADGTKESVTAETFGNIISLTRQAIVNDDMGAFSDMAMQIGRAGKLSVEVDVYALLALNAGLGPVMSDTKTLFHADHKNIGAATALSVAGIDVDRVVLGSQTDPSGNEILDLRPAVLVLPLALGGDARVINEAQYDADTANKLQKPNKVRGLFKDIVDTARLTGTRRYLFADPSIAPAIEVAFLDGQENPFLETEHGFRIDGVEWKARLDYGVAGIDYRGAVTNAG
ncbi:MAG: hypothetical protein A2428_03095 [Bdellovibrionales bacterium RIFOXYC1_FULL_54_43]|nr:MAG: hypothetical protein A2428_03095 [Bdellovibrionales bacterium RIFOXYC1_FULL_54_43]OFZ82667.1 MAG: hypothetical protein A2603_02530 [Bdellovibrionales bacterium RIFOXYD1_FULL_55_31]